MKNLATLIALFAVLAFAGNFTTASAQLSDASRASSSRAKVPPGKSHTNTDGVTISNAEGSNGTGYINPKVGLENAETTVRTGTGFEGKVTGVDSNDEVDLGSSNDATVEGTGGTVVLSGGSTVTVKNTGPAGGGDMTVQLPSGSSLTDLSMICLCFSILFNAFAVLFNAFQ